MSVLENDMLVLSLRFFEIVLSLIGLSVWIYAIISMVGPKISKNFGVQVTERSLRVLYGLSNRYSMFILIGSAVFLVCSIVLPIISREPSPLFLATLTFFVTLALRLLVGPKGFEMPLGYGLSMTVDEWQDADDLVSRPVCCFHVKKNFVSDRRQVTNLIVSSVSRVDSTGMKFDMVLKSWVFAERKGSCGHFISSIRSCMQWIRILVCIAFILLMLVILPVGIDVYGKFLFAGLGLSAAFIVLIMCLAKKIMRTSCRPGSRKFPTDSTRLLAEEIVRKNPAYAFHFIAPRPIPMIHLLAFSLMHHAPLKTFSGAEAGIVLKPI
ncbi:hypothetical protein [Pseudomonas sp. S36]|uniref:hypothetical protein n=1 Tax=Pseudomonas sp. S36 TaxID=2767447 RepID=UPI001914538F|nr:hypothetical protein [Pseudomonas sp. S36]MBK4991472.1 hypothetical protein [Pseudomonas sp. S36]